MDSLTFGHTMEYSRALTCMKLRNTRLRGKARPRSSLTTQCHFYKTHKTSKAKHHTFQCKTSHKIKKKNNNEA